MIEIASFSYPRDFLTYYSYDAVFHISWFLGQFCYMALLNLEQEAVK